MPHWTDLKSQCPRCAVETRRSRRRLYPAQQKAPDTSVIGQIQCRIRRAGRHHLQPSGWIAHRPPPSEPATAHAARPTLPSHMALMAGTQSRRYCLRPRTVSASMGVARRKLGTCRAPASSMTLMLLMLVPAIYCNDQCISAHVCSSTAQCMFQYSRVGG